jgi:putative membrane protein
MKLGRLSKLDSPAFEAAYVKAQFAAHQDALALFTSESTAGKDAQLREFATTTLPTLEHHLQMVQQLAKPPLS